MSEAYSSISYRMSEAYISISYRMSGAYSSISYRMSEAYISISYRMSEAYISISYRMSGDIAELLFESQNIKKRAFMDICTYLFTCFVARSRSRLRLWELGGAGREGKGREGRQPLMETFAPFFLRRN